MLDRTQAPPQHIIKATDFQWPRKTLLAPNLPLYSIDTGDQPIVRLELISKAGTWYEPRLGVAHLTAQMLQKGTTSKSSSEIAQMLDQYGAQLKTFTTSDYFHFQLTTLTQHVQPILALAKELLLESNFQEEALHDHQHLLLQKLKVEEEKNHFLALKHLKKNLFGNHPYGRSLTKETIEGIDQEALAQYHEQRLFQHCQVLLSGQISEEIEVEVGDMMADFPQHPTYSPQHTVQSTHKPLHISRDQQLQTAIEIGKVTIPKSHPDYIPLFVTITLLGGYFGSRLMKNLREEKGYTYGIRAQLTPMIQGSLLRIKTEVIKKTYKEAVEEIYKEIKRLQQDVVPLEELSQLSNYLLGSLLTEMHNPFVLMERFKSPHLHQLGEDFYQSLHATIQNITPAQIQKIAQQYLSIDSLHEVTVG